jgi:hypothetical protein
VSERLADLFRLEPRLIELQREVDAVRDDGTRPWFCSNFLWLPVNTRLRLLLGVARLPVAEGDTPHLYDSRAYELVFEHLSRRLPPCRACGCRRFQELRTQGG